MACTTTDPEEAEDQALSADAAPSATESEADAQRLTAEMASAEADFSAADGQQSGAPEVPIDGQQATTAEVAVPPPADALTDTQANGVVSSADGASGDGVSGNVASGEANADAAGFQEQAAVDPATAAPEPAAADPFASPEGSQSPTEADESAGTDAVAASIDGGEQIAMQPTDASVPASNEAILMESPEQQAVFETIPPPPEPAASAAMPEQTAPVAEDPYVAEALGAGAEQEQASDPFAGNAVESSAMATNSTEPAPAYEPAQDSTTEVSPAVAEVTEPSSPEASPRKRNVRKASRSEPVATEAASSGDALQYLVAPGDTLSEIAEKIYGSAREWPTIARANGLEAPHRIYPGDLLQIKTFGSAAAFAQAYNNAPETTVTVQKGDTLFSISERLLGNGSAWKYIWKVNESEIPDPNVLTPGQTVRFRDFRGIQAGM
jgi:nucleoid-associated protein YgaU